jgi:hypothetical protein
MAHPRWRAIEALFQRAADLEASAREALLDAACAGDRELRRDVETLLRAERHSGGDAFITDAIGREVRSLGEAWDTSATVPADVEPLLRVAYEERRAGLPAGHWHTALSASALGACLTALGRYRESEPLLTAAVHVLETQFGTRDGRTVQARVRLERLYAAWGRPADAVQYRPRPL